MVKLGAKVTDSITGFSGIATARTEYLDGAAKVCVEAQELVDGKPVEAWFDEPRVVESNQGAARWGLRNDQS
jgi:hypothetical protein